jgi:hypothetical protein
VIGSPPRAASRSAAAQCRSARGGYRDTSWLPAVRALGSRSRTLGCSIRNATCRLTPAVARLAVALALTPQDRSLLAKDFETSRQCPKQDFGGGNIACVAMRVQYFNDVALTIDVFPRFGNTFFDALQRVFHASKRTPELGRSSNAVMQGDRAECAAIVSSGRIESRLAASDSQPDHAHQLEPSRHGDSDGDGAIRHREPLS